jgi:glycosyltransferase involved in cell wall biosynthesis
MESKGMTTLEPQTTPPQIDAGSSSHEDRKPLTRKVPLSVLIPVKDEIDNIEDCLASVAFADDIVVVDSSSTDGTAERAKELGARVVNFQWNGQFPKKKNWALGNIEWKHEWVLILDADERIVPELAQEIARAIKRPNRDGYYINRRFMFMGGWLRHCGYYPSWNLRLFKHGKGRYERLEVSGDTGSGDNEVHEHIVMDGVGKERIGALKHDMLHYAYPSIAVWIEKHNRYSNWEARVFVAPDKDSEFWKLRATPFGNPLERKRWIKRVAQRLPMRPTLRFLYHYLYKKGFLDGHRGMIFCRLLAWYEFVSIAKAEELRTAKEQGREHHVLKADGKRV